MLNITESTERELKYDVNKKDILVFWTFYGNKFSRRNDGQHILCLKQPGLNLPNHQICQNCMNLRGLMKFAYIMNHIDKQVVFIIPLSKVPIMVH